MNATGTSLRSYFSSSLGYLECVWGHSFASESRRMDANKPFTHTIFVRRGCMALSS